MFTIVFDNLGLNNIEKQLLTNLLQNAAGVADRNPTSGIRLSWRQVCYVFVDWRIYLYGLIAVGNLAAILSLTTFFPTLIESTVYSKTEAHLMTAPPYIVACICCLLASYSSSRHTVFDQGKVTIYASTTITFCGILSAFPLLLSWLTNNVGGHTKRAMAVSFVIGIAQIGGIVIPLVRLLRGITDRITSEVDL